MKHLNEEERLACVEGHASKETTDHLAQCAECAAEIESWRRSIQRLENLEWPGRMPRRASIISPVLKWAIAAGVVLCVGFGLGRFSGPSAAQIEARVKADVTRDVQQQLFAATRDRQKAAIDSTAILALLNQLRDQQAANYISLRKDLETLASTADSRLNSNSRQIRELVASFSDSNP